MVHVIEIQCFTAEAYKKTINFLKENHCDYFDEGEEYQTISVPKNEWNVKRFEATKDNYTFVGENTVLTLDSDDCFCYETKVEKQEEDWFPDFCD